MLLKPVSALAVLAIATTAASEPVSHQPLMKMSVHQMFGLARRDADDDAYQPSESVCGAGDTCAQACGSGYTTCSSKDDTVHCFNPDAKQTCCPGSTGSSCDDGFFCAADKSTKIWCCPTGMDLAGCAAKFSVAGGLVSATAAATTSTTSSSSSSSATSNSASNSTGTSYQTATTSTLAPSAGLGSNGTATKTATSTPSGLTSGGSLAGPAGALAFVLSVCVAALL